jgi:hypothetical protein
MQQLIILCRKCQLLKIKFIALSKDLIIKLSGEAIRDKLNYINRQLKIGACFCILL